MGGPRRRWSDAFPRGSVVDHPAVRELVARGDPGTRPRLQRVLGASLVAYSSTRVFMKRDAWELLPADGILVQWVRPTGEKPWAIALTRAELERVFGEVRESASWDEARCYHFPDVPQATAAFRVSVASPVPQKSDVRRPASDRVIPPDPPPTRATNEPIPTEAAAESVLRHLRTHPSLTEAEVTRIAGGPREYRRLRRHFEGESSPVVLESTPLGMMWRLVRDSR
jgi:hypothetical protein